MPFSFRLCSLSFETHKEQATCNSVRKGFVNLKKLNAIKISKNFSSWMQQKRITLRHAPSSKIKNKGRTFCEGTASSILAEVVYPAKSQPTIFEVARNGRTPRPRKSLIRGVFSLLSRQLPASVMASTRGIYVAP